jgi:hypothetical protein
VKKKKRRIIQNSEARDRGFDSSNPLKEVPKNLGRVNSPPMLKIYNTIVAIYEIKAFDFELWFFVLNFYFSRVEAWRVVSYCTNQLTN